MSKIINCTGRRKTSSARVFMKSGNGLFFINSVLLDVYFFCKKQRLIILKPFNFVDKKFIKDFDFYITVKGGGMFSQAYAVCHGISRVLVKYDKLLYKDMRVNGLITRDSRMVERKKFGLKKSRKRSQFSKR